MRAFAYRLLGRREYSLFELRQRLVRKWPSETDIDRRAADLVDALASENLVSDERFAESFVRSRIQRHQGPVKIRAEMRTRGVPDSLIAQELQAHARLVLKAMIDAAKADGQIDQNEIQRILGRLEEGGIDAEARDFVLAEMGKPMDTASLAAAARGNPQLAAELYAASVLAIEVDTPAERQYLENLAREMGLNSAVTAELERHLGVG